LQGLGDFRLGYVRLGWVGLEVHSVSFVSSSILFFTMHIPQTHAHLPANCLHYP